MDNLRYPTLLACGGVPEGQVQYRPTGAESQALFTSVR